MLRDDGSDVRDQARRMYFAGHEVPAISSALSVSHNTIYSWRRRDDWDATPDSTRAEMSLHARMAALASKEDKTGRDFKEIDLLGRQLARLERDSRREARAGTETKAPKNHFDDEQVKQLRDCVLGSLYPHQAQWYAAREQRTRFILKSRQIGASWYFAREALLDALERGKNQIFLSASRKQALQFKGFIVRLAKDVGVALKGGDKITLSNGAELHFLGTSAATAQSYTGNLYFDEVFWTPNFLELRKVASAIAMQVGLRTTYFSTPSAESHGAYDLWSGTLHNAGRGSAAVDIDLSPTTLADGDVGGDGIWRQRVTLQQAIEQGFNLADAQQLSDEYSPDEYRNLFACEFVRAGDTAFDYDHVMRAGVDGYAADVWDDWRPFAPRPIGDRPVWVGYDPSGGSGKGDSAGLVVVSPPQVAGGVFRVIEVQQLQGLEFERQAEAIRSITRKYNVARLDIDGTGIGEAVWQLVKKFYPAAGCVMYSAPLKRVMVMKAQMVFRAGRLQYDRGSEALPKAFLAIRKHLTPGGQITYLTDRAKGSNHGDVAWATMQALFNEPFGGESGGGTSFVMEF
ncbi:MAG: terminase large subunit domain-containing protein [Aeromonas sp.]